MQPSASAAWGQPLQQLPLQQPGAPASQLAKQMGVAHLCDHRCSVVRLIGNAWRCNSSGQVHICDDNCAQRVYNDRYSAVCRVSRRVFVTECPGPDPCRKRACSEGGDAPADKRGPGTGAGAGAGAEGACEGDAMAA